MPESSNFKILSPGSPNRLIYPPMRLLVVFLAMSGLLFAQPETVPAGTRVEAKLESAVRTKTAEIGDDVVAILTRPIRVADRVVVPEGSRLNGRVETVQAATRTNEGRVRLVFRELQLPGGRRGPTWMTNAFTAPPSRRGLKYVLLMGTGAAAGAIIGGKHARVTGILGGLLTGFVLAGNGRPPNLRDLTLKAGQQIPLELREDLAVP